MNSPAEIPDIEEITRFLRRFSDLMSTGHNADHLLRAAALLEYLVGRAAEAEQLLREEKLASETNSNLYDLFAIRSAELESEVAALKDGMIQQQRKLNDAVVAAAADEQQLRSRAEQAEAQLAAIESALLEAQSRLASPGDTHVLVPVALLRHAQAQFEALAGQVGDVISRVMCEVGASTLDRAILDSAEQQSAAHSTPPVT